MKEIQVTASRNYTVTIGNGVLAQLIATIRTVTDAKKVCIVTDCNVWTFYGKTLLRDCHKQRLPTCFFVFSPGEDSKSSTKYIELLNFLAKNGLTRTDGIVALGGGVVGDLAGFAAATYLRGIPYIQVPTTLLAMVDSSVGGKTAIDLPAGKNLAGAFHQPAAVLCDPDVLATLPEAIFRDGCAEVIKYGILYDPALFAHLEETGLSFDREAVIARCIEWKRNVVARDEFDTGDRLRLNLGHTVGHAIEQCSGYAISHGKAVAMGMAIVSRAAKCPDAYRITALLEAFGLPTTTEFSAKALAQAAFSDKKRAGNTVNLVIPKTIGHCDIVPTPVENMKAFIKKGL